MSAVTRDEGDTDFQATIDRETFLEYLDAVNAVVDEALVEVTADGWAIEAVDPANVLAGFFDLPATAFSAYNLPGTDISVGVGIVSLRDAVELLPETDDIHVGINRAEEQIELAAGGYGYELAYLDPESMRDGPGDIDAHPTAEIVVESGALGEAIEYCAHLGNHIAFSYDAGARELWLETGDGVESGAVYLTIQGEAADRDGLSWFSQDFLRDVGRALHENREVTVEVGQECPLRLRYELAGGMVEFCQAPRIKSGDD